ncbi:MAG: molybdopterin converting factor [Planctomycetaceae bacterium]|nr:MAG: molybdopterin converting factor [Planctomycetaceae bacterium]
MVELTHDPIDEMAVLRSVHTTQAGAVVLFLGTVREFTQERQTAYLNYEAFEEMARAQMERLETEARQRWPVSAVTLVHRLGRLELGETSVAVAVSAPHRDTAFVAARWLIDTLKQQVPIWKQEHWADGTSEWMHPSTGVPCLPPRAPAG